MSKAFTRENDDFEEETVFSKAGLPSGTRNHMTSDGAECLKTELGGLVERRQHYEEGGGEESARAELRRINARIHTISERLAKADVAPVANERITEVRFGMFVTIRDVDGIEDEYRIVGVDEVDLEAGWISWLSPLSQALIGRKAGEKVRFHAPAGEKNLQILRIRSPQSASLR
jgi:transcription elongation factor GreB